MNQKPKNILDMKSFFTIIFLLTSIIALSQYNVEPVPNRDRTMEAQIRRDIPSLPANEYKNDLINEGFDVWPPADWEIVNGASSVGNQQWHQEGSDEYYAAIQYDNGDGVIHDQDEWLISPEITVPANAFLTFEFHSNPYWMVDPNNNADLNVLITYDGGTSWSELWNEDEYEWEYSEWTEVYLDLSSYETENVSIAFQYVGIDACWFYIDNVRLYAIPEFDIEITDARINFFEFYDYHEDASDFHYSSHYNKIPAEVLDANENAYLAFNAIVMNKGYGSGKIQCNVSVTDPDGIEIYNSVSYNEKVIGEMESDTVDVAYTEGEEFLLDNPKLGTYQVEYTVFVGEPGVLPIDITKEVLTKTVTFEVTEKQYSRAGDNNDDFVGPKTWVGGDTDGDILTVKYMFFEDVLIDEVQAFIHEDTDAGCQLVCNIYQYDESTSDYVVIANSPLTNIDNEDIGTWKTFEFTDPGWIYTDEEYVATSVLVGFEFYYNGEDSNCWLGCDKTSPSSPWGTLWYMHGGTNSNVWTAITNFVGVPMIKLNLHDESGAVADNDFGANISLYPNPTTDFARLSGVEGCNIEILNSIGQRLDQFVAGEELCDLDLSPYPAGSYYIRITDLSGKYKYAVKQLNIMH